MKVYVETNFVLELAFAQEQQAHCEEILRICSSGAAGLVIPAFSIAESYETLTRRHRRRKELKRELERELEQLARAASLSDRVSGLFEIAATLADSADDEAKRLETTRSRLLEIGEVIPLSLRTLTMATDYQRKHDLSPQDALVYASVILHLEDLDGESSCFLNRNSRDFDDPDLVAELGSHGCKMLPRFDSGLDFLRSRCHRPSSRLLSQRRAPRVGRCCAPPTAAPLGGRMTKPEAKVCHPGGWVKITERGPISRLSWRRAAARRRCGRRSRGRWAGGGGGG